jgi:hypothetical protein
MDLGLKSLIIQVADAQIHFQKRPHAVLNPMEPEFAELASQCGNFLDFSFFTKHPNISPPCQCQFVKMDMCKKKEFRIWNLA